MADVFVVEHTPRLTDDLLVFSSLLTLGVIVVLVAVLVAGLCGACPRPPAYETRCIVRERQDLYGPTRWQSS